MDVRSHHAKSGQGDGWVCWPVKEKGRGDQGHHMCSRRQTRCVQPNGMNLRYLNEVTRKQISVWYTHEELVFDVCSV